MGFDLSNPDAWQVSTASGRAFSHEKVWMFDNEIDWVTHLESCASAARRVSSSKFPEAFTYKAEHKQ
jgi:hypothetical protein